MPEHKRRHKHEDAEPDAQASEQAQPQAQDASAGEVELVEAPVVDIEALQKDLEQCRTQSAAYFDGWQRERADFSNYRRRVERDQAQVYQNAVGNVVKKFLVISDDLYRALKNRPTDGEAAAWSNGIELIYRKLQQLLESEGVHKMEIDGETFDPNRHEAISHEESPDHQSGQIIEVVQDGYLLGDRVLRPALVRVAR